MTPKAKQKRQDDRQNSNEFIQVFDSNTTLRGASVDTLNKSSLETQKYLNCFKSREHPISLSSENLVHGFDSKNAYLDSVHEYESRPVNNH